MSEQSKKGLVKKKITVTRNGKTYERNQWVKETKDDKSEKKPVPKKLEPKKSKEIPKDKGSFNIGDSINFMGKNLKIEKISESEKTIKLSNGKIYTFAAIKKGSQKIKKSETIDSIFRNRKLEINKSELSKAINVNTESGESGYTFTPQVYDKKIEDKVVTESSIWIKKIQKDLEKELKVMYGD